MIDDKKQIQRRGLGLAEAARYLGVSATTVRRAAERGELAVARVGGNQKGRLIFLREHLDQYIADRQKVFEQNRIMRTKKRKR